MHASTSKEILDETPIDIPESQDNPAITTESRSTNSTNPQLLDQYVIKDSGKFIQYTCQNSDRDTVKKVILYF